MNLLLLPLTPNLKTILVSPLEKSNLQERLFSSPGWFDGGWGEMSSVAMYTKQLPPLASCASSDHVRVTWIHARADHGWPHHLRGGPGKQKRVRPNGIPHHLFASARSGRMLCMLPEISAPPAHLHYARSIFN